MDGSIRNLCWAFFVPIIPAAFFFLISPRDSTQVDGGIGQLKYKLTGAFGSYFVLLAIAIPFLKNQQTVEIQDRIREVAHQDELRKEGYQSYVVEGKIDCDGRDLSNDVLTLTPVLPPQTSFDRYSGSFSTVIPVKLGPLGKPDYPEVLVEHGGYTTRYLELKSIKAPDETHRVIDVGIVKLSRDLQSATSIASVK